ncbi:queuosine precursor transporter [Thiotrichales bacterium 19S3-7]|nr:queuosine precursor transporter [Thiotrichales bacterium 19S3-7]MCF6802227.1 queuosine precursor transporter [Thiotrichales bacterium 19S3-11]
MKYIKQFITLIAGIYMSIKDYMGNHYSFKLEGNRFIDNQLYVVFRVKMNRQALTVNINDLLENENDLSKFSPKDVKSICLMNFIHINDFYSQQEKIDYFSRIGKTALNVSNNGKLYTPLAALYCCLLITAIYMSPNLVQIGNFIEPRGILIFPLTYVLADVISEVYGYKNIIKVILSTVAILVILSGFILISLKLSSIDTDILTNSYHNVFNGIPMLLLINILAIFISDFANAYCFNKLKQFTHGGHLWMRVIGATSIGEALYTLTWIPLFFLIVDQTNKSMVTLFILAVSNFSFKLLYGAISAPFTSLVVNLIRYIENRDVV